MTEKKLTHIDDSGQVHMVDVGAKPGTFRKAVARGEIHLELSTVKLIRAGMMKKGDVITVAQVAGILGAKRTSDLIPLCHPIALSQVEVVLEIVEEMPGIVITATVVTTGQTGVEMEALTAVSIAALTVYDMVKAVENTGRIQNIRLLQKIGGRSGDIFNETI